MVWRLASSVVALLIGLALAGAGARAQAPTFRTRYDAAMALYQMGKYAEAIEAFEGAYALQ
jgi:TolA-binding protein